MVQLFSRSRQLGFVFSAHPSLLLGGLVGPAVHGYRKGAFSSARRLSGEPVKRFYQTEQREESAKVVGFTLHSFP